MIYMIKCAIFDLDGTLVNLIDDLGNATDYVLEKYGKDKKWTVSDYRMFVGDGAKKLIERAFEHTLSPDELENAYEMFKIKYQEILLDNAHIYDGVKEQLDILKQKGVKIAVGFQLIAAVSGPLAFRSEVCRQGVGTLWRVGVILRLHREVIDTCFPAVSRKLYFFCNIVILISGRAGGGVQGNAIGFPED